MRFIAKEIFPGGRIPTAKMMVEHGEKAGFVVPEYLSLQTHYVRTLRTWADTLEAKKDEAIAMTSEEVYNRYMKYLRGCQHYFTDESIDCNLVTYLRPRAVADLLRAAQLARAQRPVDVFLAACASCQLAACRTRDDTGGDEPDVVDVDGVLT